MDDYANLAKIVAGNINMQDYEPIDPSYPSSSRHILLVDSDAVDALNNLPRHSYQFGRTLGNFFHTAQEILMA